MTFYCSRCNRVFEEPDDFFEDEEHNLMCEQCYHEENGHKQCDQCCEWFKEEELDGDELCKFCKE